MKKFILAAMLLLPKISAFCQTNADSLQQKIITAFKNISEGKANPEMDIPIDSIKASHLKLSGPTVLHIKDSSAKIELGGGAYEFIFEMKALDRNIHVSPQYSYLPYTNVNIVNVTPAGTKDKDLPAGEKSRSFDLKVINNKKKYIGANYLPDSIEIYPKVVGGSGRYK